MCTIGVSAFTLIIKIVDADGNEAIKTCIYII